MLYGVEYRGQLTRKSQRIEKRLLKCKERLATPFVADNYLGGQNFKSFNSPATLTSDRVASHLKNNRRTISQDVYLEKIIDLVQKNKIKIYIVLPPYRQDYIELLPAFDEMFAKVVDICKRHKIKFLNYTYDKDFSAMDFGDCDHLNRGGGIKLTRKIKKDIQDD